MATTNPNISPFQNDRGLWGLIDTSNQHIILPAEYAYVYRFYENDSFYTVYSGPSPKEIYPKKCPYLNDPNYTFYGPSDEEIVQGYRVGIFSAEKKKLILEPKYYSVLCAEYNLFLIEGENNHGYKGYGIMNPSGWWNVFVGPKTLLICSENRYIARFGDKQHLIGPRGETFSKHDRIYRNNDICLCWDGATNHADHKPIIGSGVFSYIDLDGNSISPDTYIKAGEFSEGLAYIQKDGKYGYINNKGEVVIPCIYDGAKKFVFSLAAVKKDNKWGYIDPNNETKLDFIYEYAGTFGIDIDRDISFGGRLTAKVKTKDYIDIIDHKGNVLSREENDDDDDSPSYSSWSEREIREAYEAATGKSWYD